MLSSCFSYAQDDCYELVWSDEFDYSGAPLASKWDYDIGGDGWGNNESQYYTDRLSNAQVTNGKLVITARKENYGGKEYTSARLVSRGKGDWLYGKVVVRAKLPAGRGTWPAIWMLPTDWEYGGWPASGEIDIMEHVGYDMGVVHGTVHTEAYHHSIGTQVGEHINVSNVNTTFHDYILEWTEDVIKISVDDNHYFTFNSNADYKKWPFDKRFHLILNIAVGGMWGGQQGIDPSAFPNSMEVDYVRVYQKTTPALAINGEEYIAKNSMQMFSVNGAVGNVTWTVPEGVTIQSGQGTSTVEVLWNEQSGEITASVQGTCDTYETSFDVKMLGGIPSEDNIISPFADSEGDSYWSVPDTFEEMFELSTSNNNGCIKFDIENPSLTPHIEYNLDKIYDLSEHKHFSMAMRFKEKLSPEAIRFDLINIDGELISGGFFRLLEQEFVEDCQFRTYNHTFNQGASMNLEKVKGIRFYINTAPYATAKSGAFEIGEMNFSRNAPSVDISDALTASEDCGCMDEITLSSSKDLVELQNKVYPNPLNGASLLKIQNGHQLNVKEISLLDMMGKTLKTYKNFNGSYIQLPELSKGVFILQLTDNNNLIRKVKVINN